MTEEQAILDNVIEENKPAVKKEKPQEEAQESQKATEPAPEQKEETQPAEETEAEEQKPAEEEKPETPEPAPEKEQKPEEKPPEPKPEEKKPVRVKIDENVVLVGKKPTMNYVLAAVTQFSDGLNEIHIKSRGRSISRAVDVAEVVRNRFVQGLTTDINIGTQEIIDERNNKINVSTIDIALKK